MHYILGLGTAVQLISMKLQVTSMTCASGTRPVCENALTVFT